MDQFLYEVTKPKIRANRRYAAKELKDVLMLSEEEIKSEKYCSLSKFFVPAEIEEQEYNLEKMQKEFNLGANPIVYRMSPTSIDIKGDNNSATISMEDVINLYTKTVFTKYFITKLKEIAYWRNSIEVSEFMFDSNANIEEGGFYQVTEEMFDELCDIDSYAETLGIHSFDNIFYCER